MHRKIIFIRGASETSKAPSRFAYISSEIDISFSDFIVKKTCSFYHDTVAFPITLTVSRVNADRFT